MAKPYRNLRTMVKNERGTAIVSQFDCGFDALSRKSSVVNSGGAFTADAFNLYGYNDRNELGQSSRYLGNNIAVTATPVPSEHRAYAYDPIGNRTQVSAGSLAWSYTSNELNQYTQESVPGDGTDALTYDDDGNLTAIDFGSAPDVTYTYDAENRLIAVAPPTPVANDKKTEYLYDYMGRRVQKNVLTYTDGAWVQETQKQYVYDGWNLIAEIDGSGTRYHVWGLDLSGTLQGAGGVGGLLGTFTGTAGYFALYDTNGNVTDYLDSQGLVVAHYEYDPYGGGITASGTKQSEFALRFSTKYLDDMGLYYYGSRFYSPTLGRWLSRDSSNEEGGLNLYGFVSNDPTGRTDPFGLWAGPTHRFMTWKAWGAVEMKPEEEIYRYEMGSHLTHWNVITDSRWNKEGKYYRNEWHFCRRRDVSTSAAIVAYTNNLNENEMDIRDSLKSPSIEKCKKALNTMGQLSHAYQDYYSHAIDKRSDGSWGTIGDIRGNPWKPHPDMKPAIYPEEHNRIYISQVSQGYYISPVPLIIDVLVRSPLNVAEPGMRAYDSKRQGQAITDTEMAFKIFSQEWWNSCGCFAGNLFAAGMETDVPLTAY